MTPDETRQIESHFSAYLDGELDEATRAAVEAHLVASPEARRRLEELRRVASLVGGLPRGEAPEDMSDAIFARLEREELMAGAGGVPSASPTPPGALNFGRLVGAAAVLMVAGLASYLAIDAVQESRRAPLQIADAGPDARPKHKSERTRGGGLREESRDSGEKAVHDKKAPHDKNASPGSPSPLERTEMAKGGVAGKWDKTRRSAVAPAGRQLADRPSRGTKQSPPTAKPMDDGATAMKAGAKSEAVRIGEREVLALKAKSLDAVSTAPSAVVVRKLARGRPTGAPAVVKADAPATRVAMLDKETVEAKRDVLQAQRRRSGKGKSDQDEIAERLRKGMTVADLETAALDHERIRLSLTAPDADEQTDMAWAIRAFLVRSEIQDAGLLDKSAKLDVGRRFYLARRSGRDASSVDRFVLRGTPAQVAGLVGELGRRAPRDVRVALATPTILAEGWDRANVAAKMLKPDQTDRDGQAEVQRAARAIASEPRLNLGQRAEAIDLRDSLARTAPEAKAKAPAPQAEALPMPVQQRSLGETAEPEGPAMPTRPKFGFAARPAKSAPKRAGSRVTAKGAPPARAPKAPARTKRAPARHAGLAANQAITRSLPSSVPTSRQAQPKAAQAPRRGRTATQATTRPTPDHEDLVTLVITLETTQPVRGTEQKLP